MVLLKSENQKYVPVYRKTQLVGFIFTYFYFQKLGLICCPMGMTAQKPIPFHYE